MREFVFSSEQAVKKQDGDDELFEFTIAGQEFHARQPEPGEINVLFASRGAGDNTRAVWNFLYRVLDGENPERTDYYRLRKLVEDGIMPPALLFGGDELNDEGIVDAIVREFAGRPPKSSSDSSASPSDDGPRSTGRVRGKGSVSSTSR
jgi:hypothetical protein